MAVGQAKSHDKTACMGKNFARIINLAKSDNVCARKDLLENPAGANNLARKRAKKGHFTCMHRCKISARLEQYFWRKTLQDQFC